jgi:phosphatidylserine/phosphatidylglycerophosphate/cardiolipin synthase-like enzyme
VWRSHSDQLRLNAQANQRLVARINQAGGEVLLDQRIPWFGSHHQKLFVIRHRDEPGLDVAFVGGLDLCHARRDEPAHHGDQQPAPMDVRYAGRAPWHDLVLELRGPVVQRLLTTFTERWNDPAPLDGYTPIESCCATPQ